MSAHWGTIATGGLAVAALVVQQVNRWTDRKQASRDREQAQRDAAEARARADRALAAQERVAAAHPPPSPWTLEHVNGSTFALANNGGGTAYEVDLDLGDRVARRDRDGYPWAALQPGEVRRFLAGPTRQPGDADVTVTWAQQPSGADRREWRHPLPPRLRA